MDNLRVVGNIAGFHGVKGEIKIFPLLNDSSDFKNFKHLYILDKNTNEFLIHQIKSVRFHKQNVLITLEGINDLNTAEKLSGEVFVPIDELKELQSGEYYLQDLVGLELMEGDKAIGLVSHVSELGQHRLLVKAAQELHCKHEIIVPFVDEYIIEIDLASKKIKVKNMGDLIDLAK